MLGIAAALMAGNLTGAIFNLPGLALALLMLWTAFRTIPYWNIYKFDALRDAVIVFYGLFAYVIASLILQRPATLALLIERYKRFIPCIIFLSPVLPMAGYLSGVPMVWTYGSRDIGGPKITELSCHVPAVIAFSLIGFVRLRTLALIFVLLIGLFLASQELNKPRHVHYRLLHGVCFLTESSCIAEFLCGRRCFGRDARHWLRSQFATCWPGRRPHL